MKKQLSEMSLEELWRLFPVILREYDPAWPIWYQEESGLLESVFDAQIFRIRHIGSTSVPGLLAKPTVDILLEAVPDATAEVLKSLGKLCGYTVMAEKNMPFYQLDLCKGYTPDGFAERVFHLHIRYPGDWDEPVFCEYLRTHPECAAEYAELKRELKDRFEHDRDGYTEAKGDFIRYWTAKAREETKTMNADVWKQLYDAARSVQNARRISEYVSGGEVAAAILSASGRIYTGVCVDTCSTLGICAERNAMFNMITNGEHEIRKVLAIMPDGKTGAPCGACRELMVQLMPEQYKSVEIMLDYDSKRIVTLGDLTPEWWI